MVIVLLAFVALLAITLSWVLGPRGQSESGSREVRGVLLEVEGPPFAAPDRLVLRDGEGRRWDFLVDPSVLTNRDEPQNTGHLRQHMGLSRCLSSTATRRMAPWQSACATTRRGQRMPSQLVSVTHDVVRTARRVLP